MSPTVQTAIEPQGMRISRTMVLRLALLAVLLLAGVVRLWDLGDAGFGTEYYAAGVRSMLINSHNLLYNAFDPAGILMVDKPPLALWAQVLSAYLLGFSAFALMLPQAIEGWLAVLLVWHLVRRDFGAAAGILAAGFLAVTPISIAVDRSNNTDSLLVLVLLAAVWVFPRTGGRAAPWRLILAMALIGVGFNVKMAAALGLLPGIVVAYLITARASWIWRVVHLAAGGTGLLLVSAAWLSVVAMTPAGDRPFVDSSASNSILDLAVNHNALQRFLPNSWRQPAGRAVATPVNPQTAPGISGNATGTAPQPTAPVRRAGSLDPPPGVARLASPILASQVLWLLPLALGGAVAMVAARRGEAACLWIGWAVAYAIVFSSAGGLFSPYYLVMLGPPLAVLAGVGVAAFVSLCRGNSYHRAWLPVVLIVGFAWQAHILHPEIWNGTRGILLIAAWIGIVVALGGLLPALWQQREAASVVTFAIGVTALMIAPTAWSITTVAHEGGRPLARLERPPPWLRRSTSGETEAVLALLPYLRENRGGARFLAATTNARLAAPLIIATGEPVIALGGFLGSMPVLDGEGLEQLARTGALRFVILGHGRQWWALSPRTDATQWVRTRGMRLDPAAIAPSIGDTPLELFDLGEAAARGGRS
jgi:4-amino-4-deoxy-L-arabinose transferase-like glycosyltransferase